METPDIASEGSVEGPTAAAERPTAATPKTNAEGFEILSETLQFKRYVQVVDRIVKYPNGKEVFSLVERLLRQHVRQHPRAGIPI